MSEEQKDKSEAGPDQAGTAGDGPLDLNGEPLSKGDLASMARWLDTRRAEAQANMVERHSGSPTITSF